jgi:DNA-binding NtrC family response regulator
MTTDETTKRHVLLVDDDFDTRRLLGVVIEREGLECTAVESGEEAVRELEQQVFDLLLVDKNLPGMSGIDLARTAHFMYPKLPILLITGYASTASARDAAALGVSDYITKPLDVTELRNTLWGLLRQSEGRFIRDSKSRRPANVPPEALKALVARRSSPDLMDTTEGQIAASQMFRGVSVVLIERDDQVRRMVADVLSVLNCKLTHFKTAAQARIHIEEQGLEILIAGPDVLTSSRRWLEEIENAPMGKIALMEGSGLDQVREAIKLGARGILFPPFRRSDIFRELLRTMTGLLEDRAAKVYAQ